jgi:hypothetical protein
MPGIPIIFGQSIAQMISAQDRRRIDGALRRVAIGKSSGRWREQPSGIVVTAVLADGRSGSLVLQLEVHRGTQRLRRIAKVSSLAEARAEWEAYAGLLEQVASVLCPPIEAVTEGVLDPRFALPGEDEAVVYTDVDLLFADVATSNPGDLMVGTDGVTDPQAVSLGELEAVVHADVRQFTGASASASNLEGLVAAAAAGEPGMVEGAVAVISRLLLLAGSVFYNRCQTAAEPLERLGANLALGPDLQLTADHIEADRWPPTAGQDNVRSARWVSPAEVIAAALALPGTGGSRDGLDELRAGSPIALWGLRLRPAADQRIGFGDREFISVEISPAAGQPGLTAQIEPALLCTVHGTVTGTRSALMWERIRHALPDIHVVGDGIVRAADVQLAHPFSALHQVLTEPVTGLVTGTVHGDLNPRNVLIADGQPFLIDYARARLDQALLGDFAWLEINLLRDPLSATLSLADLAEVQRLLALSDRVADLLPDERCGMVDSALAGLAAPHLTASIRILSAIRRHARLAYARAESAAGKSAQPWWREYATQLLLAAHRTFKWAGDLQTEAGLRAAVAAASVASEQLAYPDNPWQLWDRERLAAAIGAFLPLLPDRAAALPVLASLVSGLDRLGAGADLKKEIQRARARIAGSAIVVSPRRVLELRDGHDLYIDLPASVFEPRAAGSGERPSASALESAMNAAQAVVLGASGTGKTALLEELEFRLADGALGRFPVRIQASDVAEVVTGARDSDANDTVLRLLAGQIPETGSERAPLPELLVAGAVHLMVDDLDKMPAIGRAGLADSLRAIRRRFPQSPVTVCHRGAEVPAELAGWTGILLGEPDYEQVAVYLTRFHAARGLTAARAAALIAGVYERGLGELTRTPLLLWLLASAGGETKSPVTAAGLVGAYVRRLESHSADGGHWCRCAEALAGWQVVHAEHATHDEVFLAAAEQDVAAAWDSAREQLIQLGILAANGTVSRFRLQIYRDYFAARQAPALRLPSLLDRLYAGPRDPGFAAARQALHDRHQPYPPEDRAMARELMAERGWYLSALASTGSLQAENTLEVIFLLTVIPDLETAGVTGELARWAGEYMAPIEVIRALSAAAQRQGGTAPQLLYQAQEQALHQRWLMEHGIILPESMPTEVTRSTLSESPSRSSGRSNQEANRPLGHGGRTSSGHAFISYVREDSRDVDRLQQALEAAGVSVWRDTDRLWPGLYWQAEIRHAITDNALVFLACFSGNSFARKASYQNEELALAIDQLRQRRPDVPWLIPVRFDDCVIPDLQIDGTRSLASIHRADLFGEVCNKNTTTLVTAVRRILEIHRSS